MASTYTFQNAYDTAVGFSRNITIPSANQIRLCDMVNNEIWTFFPWRWSLSNLTAISLVDDTQDYAISDGDFFRLYKAWLRRTDTTPDEYHPLEVMNFLQPELSIERAFKNHRSIAYVKAGGNDRLRLEYSVELGGATVQIEGEYQTNPTKITAMGDSIPFDDRWFQAVVNGLMYYIYRFDNDPRAGDMRMDRSGNRIYTGQFGKYRDCLMDMAAGEDVGDRTIFPNDPLGDVDYLHYSGLFY